MKFGGEVSKNRCIASLKLVFAFPAHDLHRFLNEMQFVIDLNFFQQDDEGFIGQALLQVRHICVPKAFWSDCQKRDGNLLSLSDIIETGTPCLKNTSFK
nr:hypothetical protein [Tanacetum cinerariifolium]GEX91754.1 hypothetical protein [Tanacetum cinerariifolium]